MKALISVFYKDGIVDFAKRLNKLGVEIVSTGGTYKTLKQNDVPVVEVSDLTGFRECLEGRVKTLHPVIHAGILAKRSSKEHMKHLEELEIDTIDFVVVNLYPFKEVILKEDTTFDLAVENIDIGGPTMLRAAAKNYQDVVVIVDPKDYEKVLDELEKTKNVSIETRLYLMQKVFAHTAAYDALIAKYLSNKREDYSFPENLTLVYEKVQDMRYGENPHQKASFYKDVLDNRGNLTSAVQLNGKELSFNNINDTNGALELLKEFEEPTVVACKHGNPCGVGSADSIYEAWSKAFNADRVSIFGGIVVLNREVTLEVAKEMNSIFLEVIVAPSYEKEALEVLQSKKNLRILEIKEDIMLKQSEHAYDLKKINGGLIVQTVDSIILGDSLDNVTKKKPTKEELEDLIFAMKVVKFAKSNGIVIAKNKQTLGIGPGQVNRIWAARQSIEHAGELIGEGVTKGAVLASDAFFPFDDVVRVAHDAGITAIIQPGGSIKDQDSIDRCNEFNIAMVFTGVRHFKH